MNQQNLKKPFRWRCGRKMAFCDGWPLFILLVYNDPGQFDPSEMTPCATYVVLTSSFWRSSWTCFFFFLQTYTSCHGSRGEIFPKPECSRQISRSISRHNKRSRGAFMPQSAALIRRRQALCRWLSPIIMQPLASYWEAYSGLSKYRGLSLSLSLSLYPHHLSSRIWVFVSEEDRCICLALH